jgi:hypothetical protein
MTWILPRQLHTLASALDTGALSLDSNEQSQVCAQSLFVRSKPSPLRIWSAKWKRDSWTQHLSGRILKPSLGQRFATEWTSSLAATPASPSAQPDSAKGSKTRGIYGRGLQMAFDFSDPAAASLKTSKDISAWGCPTLSKTWQEWVTERRGAYSARLNAERHTSGSGCSSWPTAATRDYKGQSGSGRQERKGHPADTLPNAMAQWPSPVASEVRQGFQDRSRGMKGSQESLTTVVIKGWPTPNAADSLQGGTTQGNRKDPNLSIAVHGPPAPASSNTDGSRQGWSETNWITPQAQEAGARVETLFTKNGDPAFPGQRAYRKTPSGKMVLQSQTINQQVEMVEKSWRTPSVAEEKNQAYSQQIYLQNQVGATPKTWPTPASSGVTGGPTGLAGGAGNREKLAKMLPDVEARAMGCGKLNPRWVETLMGLPVGWTMPSCVSPVTIERMNSDCSVTVLSQPPQNGPSEC